MLKYTEGDFKVAKVNIHYYRIGGNKPPFILLHGATDNGLCWTRTAEMLSRDYDVIMPDAQGHGLSDRFSTGHTPDSSADQIAGLAKGLGLKKPFIMGHSMGAGTTASVAVKYPSLPGAIILEDPGWGMPPAPQNADDEKKRTDDFRARSASFRDRTLEDILAESRKIDPIWDEDERIPWAQAKKQFDPALFTAGGINRRPYTEIVPLIDCPTLLITSEKGIVTPEIAENAGRLWKSNKPFKQVRIMGAGHNIRREKFEEFYAAVTGFMREINKK